MTYKQFAWEVVEQPVGQCLDIKSSGLFTCFGALEFDHIKLAKPSRPAALAHTPTPDTKRVIGRDNFWLRRGTSRICSTLLLLSARVFLVLYPDFYYLHPKA
jgi:hypothetical protein